MTILSLFISDNALREAVSEQIKAAGLGELRIIDTTQTLLKQLDEGEKSEVLIIDDAVGEKKHAGLMEALSVREDKPTILMLGGTERDVVTETFVMPFRLGHLMTRLRYYIETAPLLRDHVVNFGPYRLEPQNRRLISVNNPDPIRLTEKETALLVFLARTNEPATKRDILASVWGYDERIDTHTLETHIYQLRRKLDGASTDGENLLINESGAYRLAKEKE
jgi:DNA-binding response OmpR family regulator